SLAPRKAHVESLGSEPALHLRLGERLAAILQGLLDALLGLVDPGTRSLARLAGETAHLLEQFGERARLAEELGLGVLQRGGVRAGFEKAARGGYDFVQVLHRRSSSEGHSDARRRRVVRWRKKGRRRRLPSLYCC